MLRRLLRDLLALATLGACAAARPGGELAVSLLPDNVEGDGLWIVGTAWPIAAQTPAEAFQLPTGIHKWQAKSGCVFDNAPEGGPFTLLVVNFGACDDSSLYEHLRDKLGETQVDGWGVVLPSDSADAHALHLANFETGEPPDFPGTVITVSKNLGDKLKAMSADKLDKAKLNVTRVTQEVTLDTPVHASTVQGHTSTFLYRHAGARAETDRSVTISITPTFGDPDLYVSTCATAEQCLPLAYYDLVERSPGDDVMVVPMVPSKPLVAIVVEAADTTEYTMLLSTASSIVPLEPGDQPRRPAVPRRYEAGADEYRYFSVRFPAAAHDQPLHFAVTPLTGDPDLYLAASSQDTPVRPDKTDSTWSSAEQEGQPQHRYEHLTVATSDRGRCSGSGCTYYLSVQADHAPSTFSVVAWAGDTAVQLMEGGRQAGELPAGGTRYYVAHVAGSHSDLSIVADMASGAARLYARVGKKAGPQPEEHSWSSDTGSDLGIEIRHDDAEFCTNCEIHVAVACEAACSYTLVSGANQTVAVLEDGAPAREEVSPGSYEYFKLYLSEKTVDVEVVLTVFSGNPDIYATVDGANPRPTRGNFQWSSEDAASDVLLIDHRDELLAGCQLEQDTCVLYIGVYGQDDEAVSSFSLLASAYPVSSAFHVALPTAIEGDYDAYPADFGPALPRSPLTGALVQAEPKHACSELTNAAALSGKIVLVQRGPRDDTACPLPHAYFANKIKRVQDAGAVGVVMANNVEGSLVFMGAVSGDHATLVEVPSVFVSKATGDLLERHLHDDAGVFVQLASPSGRVPLLVDGEPQHGVSGHSQWRYYELFTPPGADDVTVSVTPDFGNPDLFVRVRDYPDTLRYTWSSESEGGDTIHIAADDPDLCRQCALVVGVLGQASDTSYTLTYSVSETLLTLQGGVPVSEQSVPAGEYRYYRMWVGSTESAITVSVTGDGDVDLFFSFTNRRPKDGVKGKDYQKKAAGRNTCWTVDCGQTIMGGDAIHVKGGDDIICKPESGSRHSPCLAYVGVTSQRNSTFTLLYSVDESTAPTRLRDAVALAVAQPTAGDYKYYSFAVGDAAAGEGAAPGDPVLSPFTISVRPSSGDPDVYVLGPVPSSALDSGLRPDRNKTCDGFVAGGQPEADCYTHRSTGSAGELVSITPDASECWSASNSSCVYIIGVYSFSPTQYTITASSDEATELLFPNTASLNILRGETHKKYRFRVSADERLHVLLTPFAGNPDLFARFGRPPLDGPPPPPPPGAPPAAGGPVFKSTELSGIEVLQVSPTAENGCEATGAADGCFLHIAVQAATDCSYSIMVRMGEARIELKPGQTQAGVAAAHDSQEYWMWLEQPGRGYSVELTSFRGSPTVYSRLNATATEQSHDQWGDARNPLVQPASPSPCTSPPCSLAKKNKLSVLVVAGGTEARWTVTARRQLPPPDGDLSKLNGVQLQDRVPVDTTVSRTAGAKYAAVVPTGDTGARLCVTTLRGSVAVKNSTNGKPVEAPRAPAGCYKLPAGVQSEVSLVADGTQSNDTRVSLLLQLSQPSAAILAQKPAAPVSLQDGVPQRLMLGVDGSGRRATERLTLTPVDGSSSATLTATLAATLADPAVDASPTSLELRAYVRSEKVGCPLDAVDRASASAGGIASLGVPKSLAEYDACCKGSPGCELWVEVNASGTAEAVVTAAKPATKSLLPLRAEVGGASGGGRGFATSEAQYELLLDTGADGDDKVAVVLHSCAGRRDPYVKVSADGRRVAEGYCDGRGGCDGGDPLEAGLKGKGSALVQVDPRGSAMRYLLLAYAAKDADEYATLATSLQQRVSLGWSDSSDGGSLSLSFDAAPPPATSGWTTTYEVWATADTDAHSDPRPNLDVWCGVAIAGVRLASEPAADGADRQQLTVAIDAKGCASGEGCLELHAGYTVSVVAVHVAVQAGSASRGAVRRAVFLPAPRWRAGEAAGGMSAVGVFFLLLALSVVGYVALWLTRRKLSGRHFAADKETWNAFLADVSDHAAIAKEYALRYGGFAARQLHAVARAAYEKARELAGGGGASPPRRTTRATGGSSRARVSESMTAPLASSAAHMGSLTDGALPALAEPHEGGGVRVLAGGGGAAATFAPPEPAEAGGDGAVAPLIAAPLPASSPAMGGALSGGGVVAATTAPLSFGGGEPLQATDDNLFAEPVLTEPLSLNGGDAPLQVASVVPLPPGAGGGDN